MAARRRPPRRVGRLLLPLPPLVVRTGADTSGTPVGFANGSSPATRHASPSPPRFSTTGRGGEARRGKGGAPLSSRPFPPSQRRGRHWNIVQQPGPAVATDRPPFPFSTSARQCKPGAGATERPSSIMGQGGGAATLRTTGDRASVRVVSSQWLSRRRAARGHDRRAGPGGGAAEGAGVGARCRHLASWSAGRRPKSGEPLPPPPPHPHAKEWPRCPHRAARHGPYPRHQRFGAASNATTGVGERARPSATPPPRLRDPRGLSINGDEARQPPRRRPRFRPRENARAGPCRRRPTQLQLARRRGSAIELGPTPRPECRRCARVPAVHTVERRAPPAASPTEGTRSTRAAPKKRGQATVHAGGDGG